LSENPEDVHVHDFHLWSISMGKYALSAHVKTGDDPKDYLRKIVKLCKIDYNIDHVAIQIEDVEMACDE